MISRRYETADTRSRLRHLDTDTDSFATRKLGLENGCHMASSLTPRYWLVVRKSLCFSLRAFDAGEDLVGVFGPGKGTRVVVPVVDECADGVGQLAD
jgi:hypothetical protein